MSYMVVVSVEKIGERSTLERHENGVRLATKEEAERHAQWISTTWPEWILETKIVESDDPVNCTANEHGHIKRLAPDLPESELIRDWTHPEIGMCREVGTKPCVQTSVRWYDSHGQWIPFDKERARRLVTHCEWLLSQFNQLHDLGCPEELVTWQTRVEHVVAAVTKLVNTEGVSTVSEADDQE
jgi:Phenazine biosynthesis protein A/B